GERVFLAMELIEGPTVSAWLRQRRRTWREVRDVFLQAGRGLAAAHAAGIVHRDVKPQNLLLSRDRVVVADFGLARSGPDEDLDTLRPPRPREMIDTSLTLSRERVGTPPYMAPEQLAGGAITARADQYSFCVSLYEALFGRRPFSGRSVGELQASMEAPAPSTAGAPRFLGRLLARGLSADPSRRYPSMDALLADLARDPARTWGRVAAVAAAAAGAAALLCPPLPPPP